MCALGAIPRLTEEQTGRDEAVLSHRAGQQQSQRPAQGRPAEDMVGGTEAGPRDGKRGPGSLPRSVRRQPQWDSREGRAQPDTLGHMLRAAQAGLSPVIKVRASLSKTPLSCSAVNYVRRRVDPYPGSLPSGQEGEPRSTKLWRCETLGTPASEAVAFRSARAGFSFQNLRGQHSRSSTPPFIQPSKKEKGLRMRNRKQ